MREMKLMKTPTLWGLAGLAGLTLLAATHPALAQDASSAVSSASSAAASAAPDASASAPAAAAPAAAINSGDTAWMLTSMALVLMMTIPGLGLFYAGMVRKKNVLATVMQSFALCALMTIVWMVAGYSLAFTDGNAWIGDLSRFFLNGVGENWDKPFTLGAGTANPMPTS